MIAVGAVSKHINSYRIYTTWWLECYQIDLVPKSPVSVLREDTPLANWWRSTNWPQPPLTPRLLICCYCFKNNRNKPKKVCSQGDEKILIWHFSSFPEKKHQCTEDASPSFTLSHHCLPSKVQGTPAGTLPAESHWYWKELDFLKAN